MNSENCVVCLLDILGYQTLINRKSPEETHDSFLKVMTIKEEMEKKYEKGASVSKNITIQVLSDSIIISVDLDNLSEFHNHFKVKDKKSFMIGYFFYYVNLFSLALISELKYLLRGGIAKGQYFQQQLNESKNQFIFSKALVEAYKLQKKAYFPRILISDALCEDIFENENISSVTKQIISRGEGGLYYLDIYMYLEKFPVTVREPTLKAIVEAVNQQIKENKNDIKVLSKCFWFLQYHNSKIKQMQNSVNLKNYKDFLIIAPSYLSL